MKLVELVKPEAPFTEVRRKLRAAIAAGKITEDTETSEALKLILTDSLDFVEFAMLWEEQGAEDSLPGTVRNLLWRLDRLDREHESKRKNRPPH